jgi:hypothetical protein
VPDALTTIRSGPRFAAVLTAAGLAVEALGEPPPVDEPEPDEGEPGASPADEPRPADELAAAVARVREELEGGGDAAAVLEEWSGHDELDEEVDPSVEEALMDLDLALGDLVRAEGVIAATDALVDDLGTPISDADREDGFDEAVRDEVARLALGLRATLASGAYLATPQLDDWADALRALGFLRAVERPGVDDDAAVRGFNARTIEQFPPGRRFEQLAIYDGELFGVAMPDAIADEELADEELAAADSPDGAPGDAASS